MATSSQTTTPSSDHDNDAENAAFESGRKYGQLIGANAAEHTRRQEQERARRGLVEDPNDYEEDVDYTLRQQLGLRSIFFSRNTDGTKGRHPDQRGCPSWCWIAGQDRHDHAVEWNRPTDAHHEAEASLAVRASMYPGIYEEGGDVVAARIETSLEQIGQGQPYIDIALSRGGERGRETEFTPHLLKLAVDDARDLVTTLNYLIGLVDNERSGQ